jgi:hypothetical protein
MTTPNATLPSSHRSEAFRRLERDLVRRRLLSLDWRLRIELLALFGLIAAFLFWRARIVIASLAHDHGSGAVLRAILSILAVLAATGGVLAGARLHRALRNGPPGPSWLALPIPAGALARHLRWDARFHALWMVVPAIGVIASALGLVPIAWLAVFIAAFLATLALATRVGCAVALALASRAVERRPGIDALERLIAVAARRERAASKRAAVRWRALPSWRALGWKDSLLCARPTAARRRLLPPLLLGALAILAWTLPAILASRGPRDEPAQTLAFAHFLAFGLTLAAAGTWGEFLIALCGEDPFIVLRSLPLGVAAIWSARMLWGLGFTLVMSLAHAFAGRSLEGPSLALFLEWSGGASLAITMLAVNYGLTLYPRADSAQRMLALSLGLAIAGSLMIPLMGWIVLLTGLVHSARRLPRWNRLENLA